MPHHRVAARRYRLRILNVSPFRSYNLHLSNGAPMVQIATDSGLMPAPVRRQEILLGPAERVEVIVDFASARGETRRAAQRRRHAGRNVTGARTYAGALMQFRVGPSASTTGPGSRAGCGRCRSGRARPSASPTTAGRSRSAVSSRPTWQINGRTFNPAYADAFPKLGTTETWEVHNRTTVAHVMHLHHTDWYLLARDGKRPPPWEDCLKDTFFVYPGERILLAGHFSDYAGKFVVHCHMLDHEDHGLMSQFEVVRG